jgi:RNA polymerase sigma-70 factor (ECF subfamily)
MGAASTEPPAVEDPVRCSPGYAGWEAIYRDNVEQVYRLMFAKVGNRPDAEDLTAEVFAAALRPLRTDASAGEVRAYLYATARTVLAGHWRRKFGREVTTVDLDEAASAAAPAEGAKESAVGAQRRAEALLARLPPRYREILTLRFLRAYTLQEAASEMGVSVANAKVLQHRALGRAARSEP